MLIPCGQPRYGFMEDTDDNDHITAQEDTVSNQFWVLRSSVTSELSSSFICISITVSVSLMRLFLRLLLPGQQNMSEMHRMGRSHRPAHRLPSGGGSLATVGLAWADSSLRRPRAFMQLNYRQNSVSLCAREHMK